MKFKEVLEKFKTGSDPKILLDALEELSQDCSNAAAEAQRASNDYYANAKEKEKKVAERVNELKEHLEYCESNIEAFKKPLVEATVVGDREKLDSIKSSMKELEIEKDQLSTEIDMLESTHMSGDEDLYNKVVEKSTIHKNLSEVYSSAKAEAYGLAGERIVGFEKIQNRTQNFYAGGGNGPNMGELERHFHFEKYAKLKEQADKELAACEAEQGRRSRTTYFV